MSVSGEELALCPFCGSPTAYPVDWKQTFSDRRGLIPTDKWIVTIRCGNCEKRHDVLVDEKMIVEYDKVLDAQTDSIVSDLAKLAAKS